MNKKLQLILAGSLLAAGVAQAGMVRVDAADFATFTMDVDGDGANDFTSLSLYGTTQVRVNSSFDFYLADVIIPGRVDAGESKLSLSLPDADVASEDIWSGTVEVIAAPTRWNNVKSSYITGDAIGLHWGSGTKGSAVTDPVSLIGLVVDTRNFDLITSTGSVDLYYNYYGDYGFGDGPQSVSLADTGFQAVPEPATAGLLGISALVLYGIRRIKNFNRA